MQGSFVDAKEKFQGKKKDNNKKSVNKADRAWRDRRRNRHAEA